MDLLHALVELLRQVATRQMNIGQRRIGAAVTSERGDGVQFPAHPGQVGQAQMASGVSGQPRQTRRVGKSANHLGPRPQRQRLTEVAA
jgi:hypothetical protein